MTDNAAAAGGQQQSKSSGGRETLKLFCNQAANGDLERSGLILGRTAEELRQMLDGRADVDEDLEMKMHGIATERGFDIGKPEGQQE